MIIYETLHKNSQEVCRALGQGSNLKVLPIANYKDGDAILFGILRGCNEVMRKVRETHKKYLHIDRGYFGASRGSNEGYFRITMNKAQHTGLSDGDVDTSRFLSHNIPIKDWRKNGSHILVCPPGYPFSSINGFDHHQWLKYTLKVLQMSTDRPVIVRQKPNFSKDFKPLSEDLKDCWALVTHSSNAAVEALLEGIPVFCNGPCAGASQGSHDFYNVENPTMLDDRLKFFSVLANNQWNLEEMKNGICWKQLKGIYGLGR